MVKSCVTATNSSMRDKCNCVIFLVVLTLKPGVNQRKFQWFKQNIIQTRNLALTFLGNTESVLVVFNTFCFGGITNYKVPPIR